MAELQVGIRDLRARLSQYLRQVREGSTVVITDHGRVIARILPAEQTLEERLHSLREAGLLDWNGRALEPVEPPAVNRSPHSLAELIVEMRE